MECEQITNANSDLYRYVKRIVAAVNYKGEGDHEDVPSILRKFAEGYENKIKELTEEVASWKEIAECYQKQFEDGYEDKVRLTEENERLRAEDVIRLPLKVGDIVYTYTHFWRKKDGISPYQITNITLTQNKKEIWTKKYRAMQMVDGKTIDNQLNFAFEEIGKTVFLTKEEANQVAKEMLEGKE